MSSRTTNLTPIQREATISVRTLMERGYERPAAVRFTLNRLKYAEACGAGGDQFVQEISAGRCARVGDTIVIGESDA